ncbi:MAG TPA: copper-binding protein [Vicinamibacterales bacterium]|nr:copper-binding protein [Vicinamibacterales bacterium]
MRAPRVPVVLCIAGLAVCLLTACGQYSSKPVVPETTVPPPHSAKTEHAFSGTVEAVDPGMKMLKVAGDDVPGWMGPMTMVYKTDDASVFGRVKAGDRITAKVYDGDYETLYDVQIAKGGGEPPPSH